MTPARIKFLIALTSSIKNGAVKTIKQAMAFAEQQFGKIDKSFSDDIINVFKKEGKTKPGEVVPIKKNRRSFWIFWFYNRRSFRFIRTK